MSFTRKIIDMENPLVRRWWRNQLSLRRLNCSQVLGYAMLSVLLMITLIYAVASDSNNAGSVAGEIVGLFFTFSILGMAAVTTFVPSGSLGSHFVSSRAKNQLEPLLLTTLTSRQHFHSLWVGHGLFHMLAWTLLSVTVVCFILVNDGPPSGDDLFWAIVTGLWLVTYPFLQTLWSFSIGLFFQSRMRSPRAASYISGLILLLPGIAYLLLVALIEDGVAPLIIILVVKVCITSAIIIQLRPEINQRLLKAMYPD